MRRIWAVAEKEFRHMRHDRRTLALTLALPIGQLLLYGYAVETRFRNVPAALVNHDSHAAGQLLAQRISRSSLFAIDRAYQTEAAIESGLRTGSIRLAIEIPPDYTSNLVYRKPAGVRVWIDGADVATANYLTSAMDALGMGAAGFDATREQLERQLGGPPGVAIQSKVLFNPDGRSAVFLIPGLIAILIQTVVVLLVAMSITIERERGTLEHLLVSRIGADAILAGKCVAAGCVGMGETIVLLFVMRWLFAIPVQSSLVLLAAIAPIVVAAPIGIGLLIAARARNQFQALLYANVVLLPSVLLSGFVLPREFLNPPIDWLSKLLPATYLVALMRNVVLRGISFGEAAPQIAMAMSLSAVLAVFGYMQARRSLTAR